MGSTVCWSRHNTAESESWEMPVDLVKTLSDIKFGSSWQQEIKSSKWGGSKQLTCSSMLAPDIPTSVALEKCNTNYWSFNLNKIQQFLCSIVGAWTKCCWTKYRKMLLKKMQKIEALFLFLTFGFRKECTIHTCKFGTFQYQEKT